VVDVELAALPRGIGDLLAGLPLGAHEEHPAAAGHDFAHEVQRLVQQGHCLLEIDDVDAVAFAEDVR
jgi:hypothetical protein